MRRADCVNRATELNDWLDKKVVSILKYEAKF
jgi:hypothetical protein